MLLWTLGCMYLFKLVFSFSSDIYPGVELLGHMVVLILVFWESSSIPILICNSVIKITSPFREKFQQVCFQHIIKYWFSKLVILWLGCFLGIQSHFLDFLHCDSWISYLIFLFCFLIYLLVCMYSDPTWNSLILLHVESNLL